jgi:hypothetical protein
MLMLLSWSVPTVRNDASNIVTKLHSSTGPGDGDGSREGLWMMRCVAALRRCREEHRSWLSQLPMLGPRMSHR